MWRVWVLASAVPVPLWRNDRERGAMTESSAQAVSAPAVSALSATGACHCFHPRGVTEAGCACPCHTRSGPSPEEAQVGEDQPGAAAVDVVALREALEAATPGRLSLTLR
jgi:hypothetical protein